MDKQKANNKTKMRRDARDERGFTLAQMVITVAIIVIVSTFAFMSIARARANIRLAGSARELASYLEKARVDAIRRHSTASVQLLNVTPRTTYRVTMDFSGSGTVTSRDITLQPGVQFDSTLTLPLTITFDWRGRTANNIPDLRIVNISGTTAQPPWVRVGGGGDVTINGDGFIPSSNLNANLSTSTSPTPMPSASPTATPSPSVCTSSQKPSRDNCTCPSGQTIQVNGRCG